MVTPHTLHTYKILVDFQLMMSIDQLEIIVQFVVAT